MNVSAALWLGILPEGQHFNHALLEQLQDGLRQLVGLGQGCDTRL